MRVSPEPERISLLLTHCLWGAAIEEIYKAQLHEVYEEELFDRVEDEDSSELQQVKI